MAAPHETPASPLAFRAQGERPLLKAQASMEGGARILYLEASTETRDLQGDKVLLSALQASIPYFLRFGRIDLDHASEIGVIRGVRVNPYAYEIGKPLECRVEGNSIFVKAEIWSAHTAGNRFTEAADLFWDSLQIKNPPQWYPSVAGDATAEHQGLDDGLPTQVVTEIRWHSIGLSRTPVNHKVAPASTVPIRAFAKAFGSPGELRHLLGALALPQIAPASPEPPLEREVQAVLTNLERHLSAGGSLESFLGSAAALGLSPQTTAAVAAALLLQP